MILDELVNWKGSVELDDKKYGSISDALSACVDAENLATVILHSKTGQLAERKETRFDSNPNTVYRVTVRPYMTRRSTPSFNFMQVWNNDIPMPLITMVGTIEKESHGMVYMNLHGDTTGQPVQYCMRCGKAISNPVSRFFGMGPECGGHNYVNPFGTDEELKAAVDDYRKNYLQKIQWSGWVIKSSILKREVVEC